MENTNAGAQTGRGEESAEEKKQILPNSTAVLVLGIVSIVGVLCSQGILGIVLGIIGLALAGTPMKMYKENPDLYTEGSVKNFKAGRICAIIGVSLGGAFLLLGILLVITVLTGGFFALLPFLKDLYINIIPLLLL